MSLPTLLACVIFIASESDVPLSGVTWDTRVLADGEDCRINAETLLWHLTLAEGETIRGMFAKPIVRPFASLLSGLRADRDHVAAEHEARRRRWKLHRRDEPSKRQGRQAAWGSNGVASQEPSPRYALSRFLPTEIRPRRRPLPSRAYFEAAATVYMAFGTDPTNDSGDLTKYEGMLFGTRHIHFWLLRHLHLPVEQLIEILGAAVAASRSEDRGVVLPEIPRCFYSVGSSEAEPAIM